MKKLMIISVLLLMCLSGRAQTNGTEEFLDRYTALVVMVESEDVISDEEYKVFSAKYEQLTTEYHETYKALMTDDQLSKYTELKIDSVGQNVIKGVKKTGSKVSGFLKGIFNKKD